MKSLTFSIDLKSVALGVVLTGGLLTLVNFKPSDNPAQEPVSQNRRYQAITGDKGTIILDTQTGKFLTYPYSLVKVKWDKGDFNTIQETPERK
ncbi:hypothetical protein [Fibrivirga algicola]|uniref:Uncharacterized protein n=1 Tax=Fibrivirga algicola TaxID=2950420 RepID=A0ABX0QFS4_9BACT|nr:hypothetical protein [Fibrivirga algicola]NID09718.1 hypothetical protein [Fibrivirga algicola]